MTKVEWISYIKNHLKKIDETSKYHDVVIEKTIDTVHSQMFSEMYAKSKRGLYQYLKKYSISVSSTVEAGDVLATTQIPVQLPRINGGVFDVKVDAYQTSPAVSCELTGKDMLDRNISATYDTLGVQGRLLTSYFDGGLYFNGQITSGKTVQWTILPRFSTMSDTDEVKIPVGAEEILADRILDTMRMIPPVDLMIDNADTNVK